MVSTSVLLFQNCKLLVKNLKGTTCYAPSIHFGRVRTLSDHWDAIKVIWIIKYLQSGKFYRRDCGLGLSPFAEGLGVGLRGWMYPSRQRQLRPSKNCVIWTLIFFFFTLIRSKDWGVFWVVKGSRTQYNKVPRKPPWATLFTGGIYEGSSFTRWLYGWKVKGTKNPRPREKQDGVW